MKKYYIHLLLIVFLIQSCSPDEFLDVVPTGTLILETVEDYDKLLESPGAASYTWRNVAMKDPDVFQTDPVYLASSQPDKQLQYIWEDYIYTADQDDADWRNRYLRIYDYNLVLDAIDDAPLGARTEADRERVKGHALAQRAFDLFFLVNEYGPHYSSVTLNEPAIPMPLKPDLTAQLPRSTVGEVYEQIESDLNRAMDLLRNSPVIIREANFRPGTAALAGLKSWVALYKGDFELAATWADTALDQYDFLYDLNDLEQQNSGLAWPILIYEGVRVFDRGADNEEVLWARGHEADFFQTTRLFHPDLRALYEEDNDLRFILLSNDATIFGNSVSPYKTFAGLYYRKMAGVGTPDLLLVSAEGYARTGNLEMAVERLNTLRESRMINYTPLSTSDFSGLEALLSFVKEERRRELSFSGKNWFDQKRYHAYGEFVPTYERTVNGGTYTLEPGSDKYIVKIPLKVQNQNPNLN